MTPLMTASQHSNAEKANVIIDHLVSAGADVFAENTSGENVFGICNMQATCARLVERFIYPRQAAKRMITIAFPESGTVHEVALAENGDAPAPSFAKVLLDWNEKLKVEETTIRLPFFQLPWRGHRWELPALRRHSADTEELTYAAVRILDEGGYPALEWGDIIEFVSVEQPDPSEEDRGSGAIDRKLNGRRNKSTVVVLPNMITAALRSSIPCKITVNFPGEEALQFEVDGGLRTATPLGDLIDYDYNSVLYPLIVGREKQRGEIRIARSAMNGGETIAIVEGRLPRQGHRSYARRYR